MTILDLTIVRKTIENIEKEIQSIFSKSDKHV